MVSSVEMVLCAIHHATTLLFGVFASAALCGVEINGRHSLELVGVGAVTGTAFAIANLVGGELLARQVYPLVVHLPLVIYLCARYRLSPLLAVLGITSAYLSCQFSNWMGIAAFAATDSQIAYYLARIATTLAVFAVLLHWAGDIGPRLAIKSTTELGILLILPLVYYVFDYATNVYTTLFHSGSVVTVEFLAFALCAFYLMFLAVYLREYEAKEIAERERWMLATRDSAAIKELEAWRQSGRELSVLRHDMRHYLRGLAALIEEGHTDEALERMAKRPNLRVLATGGVDHGAQVELRSVDGGMLVQEVDHVTEDPATFTFPTDRKPTDAEMAELEFAWKVCKGVKSNAILVSKGKAGIGMGPGQPNRVDSALLACERAEDFCEREGVEKGGFACASDAFFPFRDNVDVLAKHGVTCIIQPGGSKRDDESIQACNEHNIAMVFTGARHFRH